WRWDGDGMKTGHGHGRQQVLASNLAHGRPATERPTLIAARQNGSIRPPADRESPFRSPIGTHRTALAMDARRTQINRYAERHPAERLSLKACLKAARRAFS